VAWLLIPFVGGFLAVYLPCNIIKHVDERALLIVFLVIVLILWLSLFFLGNFYGRIPLSLDIWSVIAVAVGAFLGMRQYKRGKPSYYIP
jgi:hypothetical protein